jgi:hypothetical protein
MKKFFVLLGLLALTSAMPVIAAETTTPPTFLDLAISSPASPACSPMITSSVPSTQASEVPSWFTADPLLWGEIKEAGCVAYCRDNCEGCCVFLSNGCACC